MIQERTTTQASKLLDIVVNMMGYASTNRGRKAVKEGFVKVNGKLITFPATDVPAGAKVQVYDKPQRKAVFGLKSLSYPVHYNQDALFVFEKPAGLTAASPDRRHRTAYSTVRQWLESTEPKLEDLYFVNKLPKEASGLMVLARDAVTRTRLQRDWNKLTKRYYVLAKGEFPEDGEIGKVSKGKKKVEEESFVFPYRRMMQGKTYALLRVDMQKEAFSELFSLLEMNGTPVPGYARRGKADNPIKRLGFHFFSIDLPVSPRSDKTVTIKTPVPREFLNLVKFNPG